MSTFFAIATTSVSVALAVAAVAWARAELARIKAFDHNFSRFVAGACALQADPSVPGVLVDDFVFLAPHVADKKFASALLLRSFPINTKIPEEKTLAIASLTEKQLTAYVQTCISLLFAVSFRVRNGQRYRQRLLDKFSDRKIAVAQTQELRDHIPDGQLCAA
jgi:hypothetical protein